MKFDCNLFCVSVTVYALQWKEKNASQRLSNLLLNFLLLCIHCFARVQAKYMYDNILKRPLQFHGRIWWKKVRKPVDLGLWWFRCLHHVKLWKINFKLQCLHQGGPLEFYSGHLKYQTILYSFWEDIVICEKLVVTFTLFHHFAICNCRHRMEGRKCDLRLGLTVSILLGGKI